MEPTSVAVVTMADVTGKWTPEPALRERPLGDRCPEGAAEALRSACVPQACSSTLDLVHEPQGCLSFPLSREAVAVTRWTIPAPGAARRPAGRLAEAPSGPGG
jgi:hypothetical protein